MSFRENLLDIEAFFLILIVEETYFIQELEDGCGSYGYLYLNITE